MSANQKNSTEVVSQQLVTSDKQELLDYWTEENMQNAIPIETVIDVKKLSKEQIEPWVQDAPTVIMESQSPDYGFDEGLETDLIDQAFHSTENPSPLSFRTNRVSNTSAAPYSTVGKMYMTFNNEKYVGTGWVVAEQAVFTAGHCVYEKSLGGWADKILFVPQFNNGSAPVGRWTGTTIHSLKGWTNNRDFKYDMGAFQVNKPIRPKTGSLGWMANYPPNQGAYTSIGYPAQTIPGYNFNGNKMWQCVGDYIGGSNPIRMHNNMTGGCSGGPWVVTKNRKLYANGLNSFRYTSQPNHLYTPYFGQGFINLYNNIK